MYVTPGGLPPWRLAHLSQSWTKRAKYISEFFKTLNSLTNCPIRLCLGGAFQPPKLLPGLCRFWINPIDFPWIFSLSSSHLQVGLSLASKRVKQPTNKGRCQYERENQNNRRSEVSKVSDRDQKLMTLLARYEVMSSKLIRETVFPEIAATNFFRRMRNLEKENFIKRIGPMLDHSYAWVLGSEGKALYGIEPHEHLKNRLTLEHDVALAQVRMILDEHGVIKKFTTESFLRQQAKNLGTANWSPEKSIVVPDGLFRAPIKGEDKSIALEIELSFKSKHRYSDLFRRYHEYHKEVFLIWYLVKTKEMGERIESYWNDYHQRKPSYFHEVMLAFSVLDDSLLKAGHADLHCKATVMKLHTIWPSLGAHNRKMDDHQNDQPVITSVIEKVDGKKCV